MQFISKIIGCGSYLPKQIVTNDDLSKRVDTSDEWIQKRTGIKQRHIAEGEETTSFMALKAAEEALERAGVTGDQIDTIILATTSPDNTFPSTAAKVQAAIGMPVTGFAFDIQAVCSGFIYALAVADNFIKAGQAKRALVIGAEHFTSLLDWSDRTTCVLFGDGAGAVVLEAEEVGEEQKGILSTHLHSDGSQRDILCTTGGASLNQQVGVVSMNGREVFRHAVQRMSEVVEEALAYNNIESSEIDWLVPHQANKRIIDSTAKKLNLPEDKIVLTVHKHGNTSAASIPLALAEAVNDGRIQKDDLVLLEAMGAGLTWGAALIRWAV